MVKVKKCLDDACTQFILYEDGSMDVKLRGDCDEDPKPFVPKKGFDVELRAMMAEALSKGGRVSIVASTKAPEEPGAAKEDNVQDEGAAQKTA